MLLIYSRGGQKPSAENARVAQLDRAFGYEPKGREFESCHARIKKDRIYSYSFLLCLAKDEISLQVIPARVRADFLQRAECFDK